MALVSLQIPGKNCFSEVLGLRVHMLASNATAALWTTIDLSSHDESNLDVLRMDAHIALRSLNDL